MGGGETASLQLQSHDFGLVLQKQDRSPKIFVSLSLSIRIQVTVRLRRIDSEAFTLTVNYSFPFCDKKRESFEFWLFPSRHACASILARELCRLLNKRERRYERNTTGKWWNMIRRWRPWTTKSFGARVSCLWIVSSSNPALLQLRVLHRFSRRG
jgi:hypothetical protein